MCPKKKSDFFFSLFSPCLSLVTWETQLPPTENVFHHHLSSITAKVKCMSIKNKKKKKKTGTFEEINATQHWQNLMKNLPLLSAEKLGWSSGERSLFIFWKVLFDRPFAVDVTLTKLAVTGLFEYGDRLIIMLKSPDNTGEGKWTELPISCWKDWGWNRVFCSENSSTNWLH